MKQHAQRLASIVTEQLEQHVRYDKLKGLLAKFRLAIDPGPWGGGCHVYLVYLSFRLEAVSDLVSIARHSCSEKIECMVALKIILRES